MAKKLNNSCMMAVLCGLMASAPLAGSERPPAAMLPDFSETRVVSLTQTVTLSDLPPDARNLRLWVPVPTDHAWQRVLDFKVLSAPGTWRIEPQDGGRGDFLFVEVANPKPGDAEVTISCTVEREGVHFPIEHSYSGEPFQAAAFQGDLATDAPLMEVTDRVQALADEACGSESDISRQAMLIVQKVADAADHYSKDASKPTCGRGSAEDCMDQSGGCCTDLHSLFIAMARARGLAARMQYGYRLLDAKEGAEFDPGYRCWVEYFIPGAGWVPTDIVAADNAGAEHPYRWASLSPYRVWLWEGRSFELTPPAEAGRIDTMLCGWAEIDGQAVDPLPGADGTPSRLTRRVRYEILRHTRPQDAPKLPE